MRQPAQFVKSLRSRMITQTPGAEQLGLQLGVMARQLRASYRGAASAPAGTAPSRAHRRSNMSSNQRRGRRQRNRGPHGQQDYALIGIPQRAPLALDGQQPGERSESSVDPIDAGQRLLGDSSSPQHLPAELQLRFRRVLLSAGQKRS